MPADHMPGANDACLRASDGLLESLRGWREADRVAASGQSSPGLRSIDANRALIEKAKGMLMRRYGIASYRALAVMVRWAHMTRTPIHTIAGTLLRNPSEGDSQTVRQRTLIRWLENQLCHGNPEVAQPPKAPVGSRTGPRLRTQRPGAPGAESRDVQGHHSRS